MSEGTEPLFSRESRMDEMIDEETGDLYEGFRIDGIMRVWRSGQDMIELRAVKDGLQHGLQFAITAE